MKSTKTLDYETELKGKPVLDATTGERIGTVSDIIINPAEGRLLGLVVLRPDKESRAVSAAKARIGHDAVMLSDRTMVALDYSGEFLNGISGADVLGTNVVTEDGRLAGTIRAIHVASDGSGFYYRVAGSTLQRVFGGGFYIPGQTPTAVSPDRKRIIVPAAVETEHARKSLDEFVDPRDQRKAG